MQIGPQNTSWAHYNTNADNGHYFNKRVDVDGDIYLYGTSVRMQKSNGYVYSSGFYHNSIGSNDYVLLAGGSYKQWTTSNTANAIVARDGNGYIYGSYFNTAISNESFNISHIYCSNDSWIRRMSLSDFVSQIDNNDTITFTKSLQITEAWMNTGITTALSDFPKGNGTYAVQISHDTLGSGSDSWPAIYSGIMTIYTGTNGTQTDEVILHRCGHEGGKRIYLRTQETYSSEGYSNIQVAASVDFGASATIVFKFRKLI